MNNYQQLLISEQGKEYTSKVMRVARKVVKLSQGKDFGIKEDKELRKLRGYGFNRNEMLAITSLLYTGKVTANEDDILGRAFTRNDWRELEDEGLVQWFRVAPPYQFVFLI